MEEEPRGFLVGKRLSELLSRPGSRGMGGHRNMHQTATFVGEDHEDEQQTVRHGRDDEEVSGHDLGGEQRRDVSFESYSRASVNPRRDWRGRSARSVTVVATGEACISPR